MRLCGANRASFKKKWNSWTKKGGQVGFFFPANVYLKMMRAWSRAEFAEDVELHTARNEAGGMTTAEVLVQLQQLEQRK